MGIITTELIDIDTDWLQVLRWSQVIIKNIFKNTKVLLKNLLQTNFKYKN